MSVLLNLFVFGSELYTFLPLMPTVDKIKKLSMLVLLPGFKMSAIPVLASNFIFLRYV